MDISVEREDGMVWVGVTGRVDGATAEECHKRVMAALEPADPGDMDKLDAALKRPSQETGKSGPAASTPDSPDD